MLGNDPEASAEKLPQQSQLQYHKQDAYYPKKYKRPTRYSEWYLDLGMYSMTWNVLVCHHIWNQSTVSQFCYIYVLLPCLHTSVINSFTCLLFSGPGACYLFAIITQQLTTRLESKQHKITDENTQKQNTHTLTLIEVSPPWGCCSLKTWATMCSVEGCNRIRREASPTITYLPIGDRLTEMALGPMKKRGFISLTGWHPSPCFILIASSFPSSIPICMAY